MEETDYVRYFMRLSYCGANYHGWQSQPNAVTVQSTIEAALSTVMRTPIKITGAGRTDTGVNAKMMIAHFDVPSPIERSDGIVRALNSIVGKDIAIESISRVHSDAHARFDAVSRTYHYYIHRHKSPFLTSFSWQAPPVLDFEKMNLCGEYLTQVVDFTSFSKLHTDVKTNNCKVTHAAWHGLGDDRWVFIITADRFLRNMVRAVVGTLVDVGRGKMNIDDFKKVVEARDRCKAGTSMPPHPLFLWDIKYPYEY